MAPKNKEVDQDGDNVIEAAALPDKKLRKKKTVKKKVNDESSLAPLNKDDDSSI